MDQHTKLEYFLIFFSVFLILVITKRPVHFKFHEYSYSKQAIQFWTKCRIQRNRYTRFVLFKCRQGKQASCISYHGWVRHNQLRKSQSYWATIWKAQTEMITSRNEISDLSTEKKNHVSLGGAGGADMCRDEVALVFKVFAPHITPCIVFTFNSVDSSLSESSPILVI